MRWWIVLGFLSVAACSDDGPTCPTDYEPRGDACVYKGTADNSNATVTEPDSGNTSLNNTTPDAALDAEADVTLSDAQADVEPDVSPLDVGVDAPSDADASADM